MSESKPIHLSRQRWLEITERARAESPAPIARALELGHCTYQLNGVSYCTDPLGPSPLEQRDMLAQAFQPPKPRKREETN